MEKKKIILDISREGFSEIHILKSHIAQFLAGRVQCLHVLLAALQADERAVLTLKQSDN